MGYQERSDNGGEFQCPPDGAACRLIPTAPYSLTHFSSSVTQVAVPSTGDCGSKADMAYAPGNSVATRWHSWLQIADQVLDTWKSPMWWAMKLARGEKIVRSEPRSRIRRSWLVSMLSRNSSSLMRRSEGLGRLEG